MKRYTKTINGKQVIKHANKIVINKDGMNIFNPKEEMILADGWVEYVAPVYEPTLEDIKRYKKEEILHFDSSDEVNQFTINGMPVWLDKATRAGLMLRFQAETAIGKTNTTLWYESKEFALTIENAIKMLYAIEVYASACYDNTQKHISIIDTFETKDEVENYDYTTGYPDKLEF